MIFRDIEVEYVVSGVEHTPQNKYELVSRFFAADEWNQAVALCERWRNDSNWNDVRLLKKQISEMIPESEGAVSTHG